MPLLLCAFGLVTTRLEPEGSFLISLYFRYLIVEQNRLCEPFGAYFDSKSKIKKSHLLLLLGQ